MTAPKSLLDKLGLKPWSRVAVIGGDDEPFWQQLRERGADVEVGEPGGDLDFIVLLADEPADLELLAALRPRLKQNGAIWVVSPRGKPAIRDLVVIAAAKAAGLVDVKVLRFSDTHTSLKLVIPLAQR